MSASRFRSPALFVLLLAAAPAPADVARNFAAPQEAADADAEALVALEVENQGPARWYYGRQKRPGHVEVELRLVDANNVETVPALPLRAVLAGDKRRLLVVVLPKDPGADSSFGLGLKALPGKPLARAEVRAYRYARPVPVQFHEAIGQGFGGPTHQQPQSRYAVDFEVPDGTPVLAARGGLVIDVVDRFEAGGLDVALDGKANIVRVEHDDGSMALYAHLAPRSARVRIGERVVTGTRLGDSGHTGYASGPHLHFAVQVNEDFALTSIPFELAPPTPP